MDGDNVPSFLSEIAAARCEGEDRVTQKSHMTGPERKASGDVQRLKKQLREQSRNYA